MTQQHERSAEVRVVPEYEVDTLGAPFRVTVIDCVSVGTDAASGKEVVEIPDLLGLMRAVVRTRAIHSRKLSGAEIKFIRSALGVRSKVLAGFLDVSPEHFSRCEAGAKVLSPTTEKMFRIFAVLASFLDKPGEALEDIENLPMAERSSDTTGEGSGSSLLKTFMSLKIECAYDPANELHFEFVRRSINDEGNGPIDSGDDGKWRASDRDLAA